MGYPPMSQEGEAANAHIRELRAHGASLRTIARQLGVGLGTVHRALPARPKTVSKASVGSDPTLARQVDVAVESLRVAPSWEKGVGTSAALV